MESKSETKKFSFQTLLMIACLMTLISLIFIKIPEKNNHDSTVTIQMPSPGIIKENQTEQNSGQIGNGVIKAQINISDQTVHELIPLFVGLFNLKPIENKNTIIVIQPAEEVKYYVFLRDEQYQNREIETTYLGSKKQLSIWAKFHNDIGIDFKNGVKADVHDKQVKISYPAPRVLSTELFDFGMWSENGWWNSINEDERVNNLKQMQSMAVQKSYQMGKLELASDRFKEHMRQWIQDIDPQMEVSFFETPPTQKRP